MKKLILVLCVSVFVNVFAMAQSTTAATKTTPAAKKEELNGEALIAKSDCLTCHQMHVKVIGPAYDKVAQKYEATPENIAMLSKKIIEGGTGVWGAFPMTPHATLKEEEVKAMVKFILTVKPE
ncbi:MAG TPA: c-type cytochrome [Cyclobacteriaceae bacterium]|nr:c-type cytochrome [Cyclobacteriaceae bacterium]